MMTDDQFADIDSMIKCLYNFAGAMPSVRYREAADLMVAMRDEIARLRGAEPHRHVWDDKECYCSKSEERGR